MNPNDNGGPAFPVSTGNPGGEYQNGPYTAQFPGMTLRDFFAAKALPQAWSAEMAEMEYYNTDVTPRDVSDLHMAKRSYGIADAMLKARSQS